MATLTEVNETLKKQVDVQKDTNTEIMSLREKIVKFLDTQKPDRLQELEDKIEADRAAKQAKLQTPSDNAFARGLLGDTLFESFQKFGATAFGFLGGLVPTLLKGAGRGVRFGAIALAINAFADDAFKYVFDNFTFDDALTPEQREQLKSDTLGGINSYLALRFLGAGRGLALGGAIGSAFGDDLANIITGWLGTNVINAPNPLALFGVGPGTIPIDLNNPLIQDALGLAAGAIALTLVRAVGGVFVKLGALGLAALFTAGGFPKLAELMRKAAGTGVSSGRGTILPAAPPGTTPGGAGPAGTAAAPLTRLQAQAIINQNIDRLPPGVTRTAGGRFLQGGRFISQVNVAEQIIRQRPIPGAFGGARPTGPLPASGLPPARAGWLGAMGSRVTLFIRVLRPLVPPAVAAAVLLEFNKIMNEAVVGGWSQYQTSRAIYERVIGPFVQGSVLIAIGSALGAAAGTAVGLPGWGTVFGLIAGGAAAYFTPNYLGQLMADWLVGNDPAKYERRLRLQSSNVMFLNIADNPAFAGLIQDYITDPSTGAIRTPEAIRQRLLLDQQRLGNAMGNVSTSPTANAFQAVRSVGQVSSARLPGQGGFVRVGEELTALDVMEMQGRTGRATNIINAPTDARTTTVSNTGFNIPAKLTATDIQRMSREGLLPRAGR